MGNSARALRIEGWCAPNFAKMEVKTVEHKAHKRRQEEALEAALRTPAVPRTPPPHTHTVFVCRKVRTNGS